MATLGEELDESSSKLGHLGLVQDADILAVAPHPDDLALSCGGLIRRLKSAKVTLLTCFSRSTYAPLATIPSITADRVQEIRRLEDEEFARSIGATRIELGLDDVTLRYPNSSHWLCENPELDQTFDRLSKLLGDVLTSSLYTHLLCPLAVGHHIDHYFTREAVRLASAGPTILFYEDLPYGQRIGGVSVVSDFARTVLPFGRQIVIDITSVINSKLKDISVYKSQIYQQDLESVISYAADLDGDCGFAERIWF